MKPLAKINFKRRGPLVLIIMDGIGLRENTEGNAFFHAHTPNLNMVMDCYPMTSLKAHGTAVGLPTDDDMGNSEVGHNALGAGRVFDQGAKLVNKAIETGTMFQTQVWKNLMKKPVSENRTLHFIGLLSDGNVHSHINQLFALIDQAAKEGVKRVRVHILLDGRDVPETSALVYVDMLEQHLAKHNSTGCDYRIASGGGRMVTTMDRYEADWNIVKRGWDAHVLGIARTFKSAREAIETYRNEQPGIIDQYLPSFTIVDEKGPVGTIEDGDSVIFFNFRGDRAIEISRAFEEENFNKFDRVRFPKIMYAGMMEYDGDLKIPRTYLVPPPQIDSTISEYLARVKCRQLAIAETQKFGHVTYFWNGNNSEKFDEMLETWIEIPSDRVQFDERPWMKAAEVTDRVIEELNKGGFDFIRLNFANGDMVGHTGNFYAAIIAAETVDLCIGRLLKKIRECGGIAVITADHGNLEEMFETDKKGNVIIDKRTGLPAAKTSHTLSPVPFIIVDYEFKGEYELSPPPSAGLGNVASTLLLLLGYKPPEEYLPPLIEMK